MIFKIYYLLTTLLVCGGEESWVWAKSPPSVRIDTKVKFINGDLSEGSQNKGRLKDEPPFQIATETSGFYNRPENSGRFQMLIENQPLQSIYGDEETNGNEYCRCEFSSACTRREDTNHICSSRQYLCCYRRSKSNTQNSEVFNEIHDERPMLFPGRERLARPFPPPPNTEINGSFNPGHAHEAAVLGNMDGTLRIDSDELDRPDLLIGPAGQLKAIGAIRSSNKPVLVGPSGPTGVIGPEKSVLVGPNGPNGVVGPEKPVLVGPSGPSGVIGPEVGYDRDVIRPSETAQRGVLVGPQGPTGIIGPNQYGRRPILVGPSGPTGIVGPRGPGFNYRRPSGPGVLVGPGGPTGIIGPGRGLLVGPGGPSGVIGPQGYYGK